MKPTLAVVSLCLLAAPALADTINVDNTMTVGEIETAIDGAAPGDTIKFASGVYLLDEAIDVTNDGVELKGSKAVLDGQYMVQECLRVNADDVTVTGFTVVNSDDTGIRVIGDIEGSAPDSVVITKNRIESCADEGINVTGSRCTITKNRSGGNQGAGISVTATLAPVEGLGGPPPTTVISSNQCVGNGTQGVYAEGVDRFEVEKNLCVNNEEDGIQIILNPGFEGEPPPPEPSVVARNKCLGNDEDGIDGEDDAGCGMVIEKNTCTGNDQSGIEASGDGLTIAGNKVERNLEEGIRADVTGSNIEKNKASVNRLDGIVVNSGGGGEGCEGGFGNTVEGNKCATNGRDGIEVSGSSNQLIKNKCDKNFSDGIDINPGGSPCDNMLIDNSCKGNHHEGIDNGGDSTDITGNKCKGNGFGEGPDIAGTGDGGTGSVDAFADNTFDTGGPDEMARNDAPDDA